MPKCARTRNHKRIFYFIINNEKKIRICIEISTLFINVDTELNSDQSLYFFFFFFCAKKMFAEMVLFHLRLILLLFSITAQSNFALFRGSIS